MPTVDEESDLRRARWRSYWEQSLTGPDSEIEAATEASMSAVARGEGRDAIMAAGKAAAKKERMARQPAKARPRPPRQAHTDAPPKPWPPRQAPPQQRTAPSAGTGKAAPEPPPPPAAAGQPPRIWPPNSAVIQTLEKRTESNDGQFFQVWSCRLFELKDGKPVPPPIAVEMRGRSIIGQLAKGDVVQIPPGQKGQTRIVKTLTNLTTEAEVVAKGRPFRRMRTLSRTVRLFWTIVGTVLAIILIAALVLGALILTDTVKV